MVEKMKFVFLAYRKWAYNVISNLQDDLRSDIVGIITPSWTEADFNILNPVIRKIDPRPSSPKHFEGMDADYFVLLGWSWMIDTESLRKFKIIGMHPSPLPLYRGGSPIQNQIITGETESAVSIFDITTELDTGPIYPPQIPFSLKGELEDVLRNMTDATVKALDDILPRLPFEPIAQSGRATVNWLRRSPDESELTESDLETSEKAYNKIRALQDPYPNAFIRCKDGSILRITKAKP